MKWSSSRPVRGGCCTELENTGRKIAAATRDCDWSLAELMFLKSGRATWYHAGDNCGMNCEGAPPRAARDVLRRYTGKVVASRDSAPETLSQIGT